MARLFQYFVGAIFMMVSVGCNTGYVKENGIWVWVTIDESNGKRNHWIEGADQKSFEVLKNDNFAKDKSQVYYKGKVIQNASPEKFETLTDSEYGYSKDDKLVFLNAETIIGADPASFEILEFPYSRDNQTVFCGTIPLMLNKEEVHLFKVTNTDKMMAGTISITTFSHFLEFNPQYSWLKSRIAENQNVIVGEWGTGTVGVRKFKGVKEVR